MLVRCFAYRRLGMHLVDMHIPAYIHMRVDRGRIGKGIRLLRTSTWSKEAPIPLRALWHILTPSEVIW